MAVRAIAGARVKPRLRAEWVERAMVRWLIAAEPRRREQVLALINPEWFITPFGTQVLNAIVAARGPQEKLDALEVWRSLNQSGATVAASVTELLQADDELEAAFIPELGITELRETAARRKLHDLGLVLTTKNESAASLAELTKKVLGELEVGPANPFRHVSEVVVSASELIGQKDGKKIPTGLKTLDAKIGGLTRGWLTIIGARPSVGKTALALRLFRGAAESGVAPVYLSYEMPDERLVLRMAADLASIENQELQRGNLNEEQIKRASQVLARLTHEPMYFIPPKGNWPQQIAKVRAIKTAVPELGLCVIDYLTLIEGIPGHTERWLQIGRVTRDSIRLAQELDIAIVLLSQLRREAEGRPPALSDLRESGNAEQDADLVMLLWRPGIEAGTIGEEDNRLEIRIEKNRDGRRGKVTVYWDPRYTRIADMETCDITEGI